jgi:AcrR family transcriptional regulator
MVGVTSTPTRSGRRKGGQGRGDSGTRVAIVAAARRQFAESGYDGASLRSIAAEAGVTSPLIVHFFGSKANLLIETIGWPFEPSVVIPQVAAPGRRGVGERMTRVFAETWDKQSSREAIMGLLRAATEDSHSAALLREFLVHQIFTPLAVALHADQPQLRGALAAGHLMGLAMARHVLEIEPLASMTADEVVALAAPTLQRLLTGTLPIS